MNSHGIWAKGPQDSRLRPQPKVLGALGPGLRGLPACIFRPASWFAFPVVSRSLLSSRPPGLHFSPGNPVCFCPGPTWPQLRPPWPQRGPTWTQFGPSWLQFGPSWPLLGPTWPQLAPTSPPTWSQLGPKFSPSSPDLAPFGPTWTNLGPNLVPTGPNLGAKWPPRGLT